MVGNYQPTVLSGSNAQSARFGSSIVFGGDLDQNGFYDVIIGAPLEETSADSSGVIYVYYGSSKGLSEERKQVNFIVSLLCAINISKVTEIRGFVNNKKLKDNFTRIVNRAGFFGSGAVLVGFGPNLDKNFWLILSQTRRF